MKLLNNLKFIFLTGISVGSFGAYSNESHLPFFSPLISNELFVEEANIKQIGVERLSQIANHYQSNQFKFGNFYTWHFINGDATEILACSSNSENRQSIIECVKNPASFGNIQFQLITGYELNEIIWLDDADVQNLSLIEAIKASDFSTENIQQYTVKDKKLIAIFNTPWAEPYSISLCVTDIKAAKTEKQNGLSCFHFPYTSSSPFEVSLSENNSFVAITGEDIEQKYTHSPGENYHYRYKVQFDTKTGQFKTIEYLPITNTPICVQLGSFSVQANAKRLYHQIAWAHPNIFIHTKAINGKTYYQLILASHSKYHADETLFDLQEIFGSESHGFEVKCPIMPIN